MSLLNKGKKITGIIRSKTASSIGALKRVASPIARKIGGIPVLGKVARAGFGVAKFAGRTLVGGKVRAAVTLGTVGIAAVRKLRGRASQANATQTIAESGARKTSLGKKILKGAGIAAGVATGAFVGEQIAEKLGVRGGAGFFGKRRKKKKGSTRRARRGRSRRGGRRVSFTTRDGRRVSFMPKARASKLSYRRKRGRRGRGISKTELRQIKALIRRGERD